MSDFDELARYPAIGWDFDQTLIDNPESPRFWAFIHQHPEIQHYIITFRSQGLQNTVFSELAKHNAAPDATAFANIFNMEDAAWTDDQRDRQHREQRRLSGLSVQPFSESEEFYRTWKGQVCHTHGIPVLVDDNIALTLPGCEHYDVRLFHSLLLEWAR